MLKDFTRFCQAKMFNRGSVKSVDFKPQKIPISNSVDPRWWIGRNERYQIEIQVFSYERNLYNCFHRKCRGWVHRGCSEAIACTCFFYCFTGYLCRHARYVHEKCHDIVKNYQHPSKDVHLEALMNETERKNKGDRFLYEKYFSDEENFFLNNEKINRNNYWKGYETVLARHHYGMKLLLNKYERKLEQFQYEFTYKKNGVYVTYHTRILSGSCKCKCSAFEICSTCRMCRHRVFCDCEDYAFGYFCVHCHATVMAEYEKRRRPYQHRKLGSYYRNSYRRFFYIGLFIRVRHNVGIRLPTIFYRDASVILVEDRDDPEGEIVYEVRIRKSIMLCMCDYLQQCCVCKICMHTFKCYCVDFKRGFLCVHIHAANLAVGGIKNYNFLEEDRTIDEVSSFDEAEEERLENNHPFVTWSDGIFLEHHFLAYKHLFFEYFANGKKDIAKIVLVENDDVIMIPFSTKFHGDYIRLLRGDEDDEDAVTNGEILSRECKRDLIFHEYYSIYFPNDSLDSYEKPPTKTDLPKKKSPSIQISPDVEKKLN